MFPFLSGPEDWRLVNLKTKAFIESVELVLISMQVISQTTSHLRSGFLYSCRFSISSALGILSRGIFLGFYRNFRNSLKVADLLLVWPWDLCLLLPPPALVFDLASDLAIWLKSFGTIRVRVSPPGSLYLDLAALPPRLCVSTKKDIRSGANS